ncbi:TPA_asm: phosphoprotein [Bombay duck fish bornavirus]|uniref:Phosphoprotein n=1 Tax=Bombay duck fish bornavirus TaxID=3067899 RepID=A0AA48SFL9_9MONO|nr:TPA_asm: phosphoprotein [Bombay duck fish bornavirus]
MPPKPAKVSQLQDGAVTKRVKEERRKDLEKARTQAVTALIQKKVQEIGEREGTEAETIAEAVATLDLVEDRAAVETPDIQTALYMLLNALKQLKEEKTKVLTDNKERGDKVLEIVSALEGKLDKLTSLVADIQAKVDKLHLSTYVGQAVKGEKVQLLPKAPPPYVKDVGDEQRNPGGNTLYPDLADLGF